MLHLPTPILDPHAGAPARAPPKGYESFTTFPVRTLSSAANTMRSELIASW